MKYKIRKAKNNEFDILKELMKRSLSEWNYSELELTRLIKHLEFTPEMLSNSVTYVAELNNQIKGFWCHVLKQELSDSRFYIYPTVIRTGVGTLIWNIMISDLKQREFEYFTFLSDPHSQGFYEKKGAVKIGQQPSEVLIGKNIPIMRYYLK